jgi:6-pyruvoyl-tetrahydropterin synthase
MYTITVRDHMMIAHSFRGELFGPAQKMHGATYVVDVELSRQELDEYGVVVDIGRACQALAEIMALYSYKNLDEEPALAGLNTTTENMARLVFEGMEKKILEGVLGPGSDQISAMKVTLKESHLASASYQKSLK